MTTPIESDFRVALKVFRAGRVARDTTPDADYSSAKPRKARRRKVNPDKRKQQRRDRPSQGVLLRHWALYCYDLSVKRRQIKAGEPSEIFQAWAQALEKGDAVFTGYRPSVDPDDFHAEIYDPESGSTPGYAIGYGPPPATMGDLRSDTQVIVSVVIPWARRQGMTPLQREKLETKCRRVLRKLHGKRFEHQKLYSRKARKFYEDTGDFETALMVDKSTSARKRTRLRLEDKAGPVDAFDAMETSRQQGHYSVSSEFWDQYEREHGASQGATPKARRRPSKAEEREEIARDVQTRLKDRLDREAREAATPDADKLRAASLAKARARRLKARARKA